MISSSSDTAEHFTEEFSENFTERFQVKFIGEFSENFTENVYSPIIICLEQNACKKCLKSINEKLSVLYTFKIHLYKDIKVRHVSCTNYLYVLHTKLKENHEMCTQNVQDKCIIFFSIFLL